MTNSLDEVSRLPLFLEEIAEETGMGMAEMMSLNAVSYTHLRAHET